MSALNVYTMYTTECIKQTITYNAHSYMIYTKTVSIRKYLCLPMNMNTTSF